MKNVLHLTLVSFILVLVSACNQTTPQPSTQKMTYRLIVKDYGERICCGFDGIVHELNEPCVYDTSFYREVNERCTFTVFAECNEEQNLSFVMQILRNDVEVKSKTYIRQNLCGSVSLSMEYFIVP